MHENNPERIRCGNALTGLSFDVLKSYRPKWRNFGNFLKEKKDELGISLLEVAEKLDEELKKLGDSFGMSITKYSEIQRGEAPPVIAEELGDQQWVILGKVLNCSAVELQVKAKLAMQNADDSGDS